MSNPRFSRLRGKMSSDSSEAAFTRIDLVTVAFVLVLCCVVLLPALARTQPDSRVFQCLNNHRQLTRAWLMYAADNNERLATSLFGTTEQNPPQPTWATGWLDWSSSNDNTNSILLTDPRYSILANYLGRSARPFKCPADHYLSPFQRSLAWKERVRSVSQNILVGNGNTFPSFDPAYLQVTKLTELLNPKPAETWISIDEHPDSINDGALVAPRTTEWIDLPANLHEGGAGVAFADGRAEMHRWRASVLNVPVRFQFTTVITPLNDPDIQWLRSRTPQR